MYDPFAPPPQPQTMAPNNALAPVYQLPNGQPNATPPIYANPVMTGAPIPGGPNTQFPLNPGAGGAGPGMQHGPGPNWQGQMQLLMNNPRIQAWLASHQGGDWRGGGGMPGGGFRDSLHDWRGDRPQDHTDPQAMADWRGSRPTRQSYGGTATGSMPPGL